MNKHLLLTISEDQSALHGVRFVGRFFENRQEMNVTLYYTAQSPEVVLHSVSGHKMSEQQGKTREMRGNAALEHAKDVLERYGFQGQHVDLKLNFGSSSKASDIVLEAEKGLYDAVVLGRRGVSWLEEAMGQSVSRQMLEDTLAFPVWICREPDLHRRNVLLCVDGAAPSLRMADHVGFMLADQPQHSVTMLTVAKDQGHGSPDEIFHHCLKSLRENGVTEDRVSSRVLRENNIPTAILQETHQGAYAVVAMGRTGAGGGLLQRFFMGSSSSTLFSQLDGAVLWVSH